MQVIANRISINTYRNVVFLRSLHGVNVNGLFSLASIKYVEPFICTGWKERMLIGQ